MTLERFSSLIVVLLMVAVCGAAAAATCTSTGTGNWSNSAIWSGCGGGVPGAGDDVVIANLTHIVTVTDNRSANQITFTAGGNLPTLRINSGITLTVTLDITLPGPTANGTRTLDVLANGVLNVGRDLIMDGGNNDNRDVLLQLANGANTEANISGDFGSTAAGANFNDPDRVLITFLGQGTLRVGGNLGGNATLTSATGIIEFNGIGAQSIPVYNTAGATNNYNHITINKTAGTATLAGSILVRGNFTNNSTSAFSGGPCAPAGSSFTVTFNGAAAQSLLGTAATGTNFCRVALNNAADLTLQHDLNISSTANGLLTLTAGEIITGTNRVFIANGTAIASAGSGGNNFVVGNLTKAVATGASITPTFEVGTQTGGNRYAPALLFFNTVTTAGNVTVRGTAGSHASLGTSGLDTLTPHKLNRYWTITNGGVVFANYAAVFVFVAADIDAGANPLAFVATRFAGGAWNPTNKILNGTTFIAIQGETGFGDFAAGEVLGYSVTLGRFNAYDPPPATPAGAVHGQIRTKVAGTGFSLTLVHLNAAGTALTNLSGSAAQRSVTVDLMDGSDNSGAFANNCRASWKVVRSVTFTWANNTDTQTVNFTGANTENNSWREVRVRVTAPNLGETGCSGDRFAIRPDRLVVSATDGDWQTTGTGRALANAAVTGGNVHAAGRQFTLSAIAQNSALATTSNYDGSPTITTNTCALPAVGCTLGTLTLGAWSGAGTRSAAADYNEVGAINLALADQTYASVDTADSTTVQRFVSQSVASVVVGRFVPDRFDVTTGTAPAFRTFNATDASCTTPSRSFTYIGQPFQYAITPTATITGKNSAGGITTNYKSTLWKVGVGTPSVVKDCTTNPNICQFTTSWTTSGRVIESYTYTLTPASTPNWDNAASAGATVSVSSNGDGTGTVSFPGGTSDTLAFLRNAAAPQVPFTASITNTMSAEDNSEAAAAGNGTIGTTSPAVFNGGGGIAFDGVDFNAGAGLTAGKTFVYGRLRVSNANGSQLLPLRVPVETQFWNGSSFITNAADHCTALAATNITMSNFQVNLGPLASCKTSMNAAITFASGRGNVLLSAPGSANNGSVDLTAQLGSGALGSNSCEAGLSPPPQATSGATGLYLQGNWTGGPGGPYTQNPTSRATFGVYKGAEEIIYFRENF